MSVQRHLHGAFDLITLCSILWLFLHYFPLPLVLAPTQLIGGDMTGHYYYAWYLRHVLLPQGRVFAWSNDLLMGYPTFQYYFLFPFFAAASLGFLIPFNVAFKIVILLSMISVPVSLYIVCRLLRIEFPGPAFAALISTALIFSEKNYHTGFYVLDNVSGQFCSTLALSLLLVFLGMAYRCLREDRPTFRASGWLIASMFSHAMLVPLFAVAHVLSSVVFTRNRARVIRILLPGLLTGLACLGIWVVPFLFDTDFGASPRIAKAITVGFYRQFVDGLVVMLHLLALQGAWRALSTHDARGRYLLHGAGLTGVLLLLSLCANRFGGLPVLDRYLPLYLSFVILLAAYAIACLLAERPSAYLQGSLVALAITATLSQVLSSAHTLPPQARVNWAGLEDRPAYWAFREMTGYLAGLPGADRVSTTVMYDSQLSPQMAGPFLWDTLPQFINKPVVAAGTQGFYSLSFSAVAHYLYAGPLSRNPEQIDLMSELYNVRYFLKSSKTVMDHLDSHFTLLKEIPVNRYEAFQVFERKRQQWHYVAVPAFAPVRYDGGDTKPAVLERLFQRPAAMAVPLVLSKDFPGAGVASLDALASPPLPQRCVIDEQVGTGRVAFTTTCPQQPHIVRMSYHPGWRSRTGENIYQVAPNFMLLSPRGSRVELAYGPTWAGWLGRALSVFGLLLLLSRRCQSFVWHLWPLRRGRGGM